MPQKITYGVILAVFVYFDLLTFTYEANPNVALFPRMVFTIGVILCILKLFALFSPKIAKMVDAQGLLEGSGRNMAVVKESKIDEDAMEDGIFKEISNETKGYTNKKTVAPLLSARRLKELVVIGWVFLLTSGIWLVGFYITGTIMVFTYIKLIGKRPWLNSVLLSGATPLIFYVVFRLILKIPLYPGVFFYY